MTALAIFLAAGLFAFIATRYPREALILAILISQTLTVTLICYGFDREGLLCQLILSGAAVGVVIRGMRRDTHAWARTLALTLLCVQWALSQIGLALGLGRYMYVPGWGTTTLLVIAIVWYAAASRRAATHCVVSTLAASMRQHLPLPQALVAASAGRSGKQRRILRNLAACLGQGLPLGQALRRSWRGYPGHVVSVIEAAERMDQLPQALQRLEAELADRAQLASRPMQVFPWYPALLLWFMALVLTGAMTFVLPSYTIMLREMGMPLPAPTAALLTFMRSGGIVLLLAVLALGALVVLPTGLYTKFRSRRVDEFKWLSFVGDVGKWHLPFVRSLERNKSMLRAIGGLRMALAAGATVDDAVEAACGMDVNWCFRVRLRRWLRNVRQGWDVASACRASRVGRALAWAFDSSANPHNTPAVLEMLETHYRSSYEYRANLMRLVAWPCLLLAVAGVVAWVVYALYCPLIAIDAAAVSNVVP